jgi:hypothetical protein
MPWPAGVASRPTQRDARPAPRPRSGRAPRRRSGCRGRGRAARGPPGSCRSTRARRRSARRRRTPRRARPGRRRGRAPGPRERRSSPVGERLVPAAGPREAQAVREVGLRHVAEVEAGPSFRHERSSTAPRETNTRSRKAPASWKLCTDGGDQAANTASFSGLALPPGLSMRKTLKRQASPGFGGSATLPAEGSARSPRQGRTRSPSSRSPRRAPQRDGRGSRARRGSSRCRPSCPATARSCAGRTRRSPG